MDTRYPNTGPGSILAALALLLVLAVGLAVGGEQDTRLEGDPGGEKALQPEGTSLVSMSAEEAAGLSPMLREMRQALISERDQLAVLYDEFSRATDSRQALAVQKRIRQVKFSTKITLLEVQATAARDQGRTVDVERLENVIAALVDRQEGNGLVRSEAGAAWDGDRRPAEAVKRVP